MNDTSPSPSPASPPPVGLIAAEGRLPILTAEGIRAAGRSVACVGIAGHFAPELPDLCNHFRPAGVVQLGRWIRLLRRWRVEEAVMVGRVRKARMYQPLRLFRQLPDLRAVRLWYRTLRNDRRTDALLGAVAGELQSAGISLIDTTRYIPEHLAGEGILTSCEPSARHLGEIAFGLPIVHRMGDLDVGQSIAVRDREVIAVEAIEGTDAMIRRAGELCPSGDWVLIKVAKPDQDPRFDVPTVGLETISNLKAAGARCLAVEAGRVILLDRPDLLAAADRAGIAIVGVKTQDTP